MPSPLLGIIPAAGSGIRARPYTYEQHKGLFSIDGKPNILRLIEIMRDDVGITEIVIVLGYKGESIREHFGDGSDLGVRLNYIENHHLDKGWAWSVLLAKPFLGGRNGCVMLADEFYLDANLGVLASVDMSDLVAACLIKPVDDPSLILKNFSVEVDGDRVTRMVENPETTPNDLLGMATFVITGEVLDALEAEYESGRTSIQFVDFIDKMIRQGHNVAGLEITGEYVNLNDVASLELAQDLAIRRRLGDQEPGDSADDST